VPCSLTYWHTKRLACNTDTTPTQPHRISNPYRTKNKTTNVVIQQHSRKLLMMDILTSETCWAHKKWNKLVSDINLVFYCSICKMFQIVTSPDEGLLPNRPSPLVRLSPLVGCLWLHILPSISGGLSSIRQLIMRHAIVTGTAWIQLTFLTSWLTMHKMLAACQVSLTHLRLSLWNTEYLALILIIVHFTAPWISRIL